MQESLGGRPRAVQGEGRHERSSVEIHRLVMISELLSAIHGVDAGVDWNGVAAFLQQQQVLGIFFFCSYFQEPCDGNTSVQSVLANAIDQDGSFSFWEILQE